jgi:chromosome segregation ATPase
VKQYLELACPNCQRSLRVRTEYLGKRIVCKHCQRQFTPVAPAVVAPPVAAPAEAPERVAQLEEELRQARDGLAHHQAEYADALRELERVRGSLVELEDRSHAREIEADELRERVKQEAEQHSAATARLGELDVLRAERDQLTEARTADAQALAGLRARADDLERGHSEAHGQWETERQALAAQADQRVREELEAARQRFATERKGLQGEIAVAVRQHEELLRERDELAAGGREAEQSHRAAVARLQEEMTESRRATETAIQAHEQSKEQHRQQAEAAGQAHAGLEEQIAGFRAELARLEQEQAATHQQHEEALRARDESAVGQREAEQSLRTEVARLQEGLTESRGATDAATQAHAGLKEQAAALRAEVARLQEELTESRGATETATQAHAGLNEQVAALHAELARLEQEQQADVLEVVEEVPALADDSELLQAREELAAAHRESQRHREVVAALEERAGHVAEADADLRAARSEIQRLRGDLAAAVFRCEQIDSLSAERQQLIQHIRALQAEVEKQRQAAAGANQATVATTAVAVAGQGEHGSAEAGAQLQRWQQHLDAVQQEFAKERAMLQHEVNRLWQENNQLRQWLGSCGVQFLNVSAPRTNP